MLAFGALELSPRAIALTLLTLVDNLAIFLTQCLPQATLQKGPLNKEHGWVKTEIT